MCEITFLKLHCQFSLAKHPGFFKKDRISNDDSKIIEQERLPQERLPVKRVYAL